MYLRENRRIYENFIGRVWCASSKDHSLSIIRVDNCDCVYACISFHTIVRKINSHFSSDSPQFIIELRIPKMWVLSTVIVHERKKWQRSPRILSRRVRIAKISTLTITTKKSNDHNRQNRSDCVSNASSRVAGITIILYFESERMW